MKKVNYLYSLRLSKELKERLDEASKNFSKPKSVIVREALEAYLNEVEDFGSAIQALEELKDGDYKKASKKIDEVIKEFQEDSDKSDNFEDLDSAIQALEELKDGDYKKASKKIDKIVEELKKK